MSYTSFLIAEASDLTGMCIFFVFTLTFCFLLSFIFCPWFFLSCYIGKSPDLCANTHLLSCFRMSLLICFTITLCLRLFCIFFLIFVSSLFSSVVMVCFRMKLLRILMIFWYLYFSFSVLLSRNFYAYFIFPSLLHQLFSWHCVFFVPKVNLRSTDKRHLLWFCYLEFKCSFTQSHYRLSINWLLFRLTMNLRWIPVLFLLIYLKVFFENLKKKSEKLLFPKLG